MRSSFRLFALSLFCTLSPAMVGAGEKLVHKSYQVLDLIVGSAGAPVVKTAGGTGNWRVSMPTRGACDPSPLINLICDSIDPSSWKCNGGRGLIDYFPLTTSFVVTQTQDNQEQVADFLVALRRAQKRPKEIRLDTGIVEVSDAMHTKLMKRYPIQKEGRAQALILSSNQVEQLLTEAQQDRYTSATTAPRMTLFDNQKANLQCVNKKKFITGVKQLEGTSGVLTPTFEEFETGFRITYQPRRVKDKVQIHAQCTMRDISNVVPVLPINNGTDEKPQYIQKVTLKTNRVDKTVSVPDGASALISGMKIDKVVKKRAPVPILSYLPVIGQLIYTEKPESVTFHRLMVVTPKALE